MLEGDDIELGRIAAEIDAAGVAARKYRAKDFWVAYTQTAVFLRHGPFP